MSTKSDKIIGTIFLLVGLGCLTIIALNLMKIIPENSALLKVSFFAGAVAMFVFSLKQLKTKKNTRINKRYIYSEVGLKLLPASWTWKNYCKLENYQITSQRE